MIETLIIALIIYGVMLAFSILDYKRAKRQHDEDMVSGMRRLGSSCRNYGNMDPID